MSILILAAGELQLTERIRTLARGASYIIAADGGARHAQLLDCTPDIIVGDFDSVSPAVLSYYQSVPQTRHPSDKDQLDLELALELALRERPSTPIIIMAATGGRLDQSLAAVFIAARYKTAGSHIQLESGKQTVYFLAGQESLKLNLVPGTVFSLLSLSERSTVSLQGAQYELEHHLLPFGVGHGVSNRSTGASLRLRLAAGLVLLVVEYDLA